MDSGAAPIPFIPQPAPTPIVQPTVAQPIVQPLARPQAIGAPGPLQVAPPAASFLPGQYGTDIEIINAVNEAASPSVPLFNENPTMKSKIEIYKIILKSLSVLFANINLDTKRKIFDGFYSDVLKPVIDSSTYLVADSTLDDIVTKVLGEPSKTTVEPDKYPVFLLLKKVQDDLKKITAPSTRNYSSQFNNIYTNLLSGRSKLESLIKKQTTFSNELDVVKAMDLDKFVNKVDAYQGLIAKVNQSITLTNRKDLITDIGRLMNMVRDDAMQKKIVNIFKFVQANKFFTDAEKAQLAEFEKSKSTAVATSGEVPVTVPGTKQPEPAVTQTVSSPQASIQTGKQESTSKSPTTQPASQDKKVVVNIDTLKNKLTAAAKNYTEQIKICYAIIKLFPTITSADNKKSLVPIMTERFTLMYNNRSALKKDELNALVIMLGKVKNIPELENVMNPQKVRALTLMSQLNNASAEPDYSKKIANYAQISTSINKDIDLFEKGRFTDGITSLFSLRKKMSGTEVDALKNFLNNLNANILKDKSIFDNTLPKILPDWLKIIECTSVLFSQIESKSVKEQIPLLKNILDKITTPNAEYEKKQLITVVVPQLYYTRGDLLHDDIEAMKDLFTTIQNKSGLLASNQISTMVAWISELDGAAKITTGQKIYITALLDNTVTGKDLGAYEKLASLFTPQTPVPVMAAFVGALNTLFKARNAYDKKKVLTLFRIIDQQKLSNKTNLLGPAQKKVMVQWIKILSDETKPVKPAATTTQAVK